MPKKKLSEKQLRRNYREACRSGKCPSIADKENKRVIELATRLKSTSDKETLANIQEWQNNNVAFWFERFPLPQAILAPVIAVIATTSLFVTNRVAWFWCVTVLLTVFVTLFSVAVYMVHSYRKLPLKQVFSIFLPSMPIDSILDNGLGVCRDYAKLSASLLFNIYPEREIYFVHAPSHVATGIMVKNKLYVLDKYLPVATIDQWHKKWHPRRSSDKKVEKAKGEFMQPVDLNTLLSRDHPPPLDTTEMENKMKGLINIHGFPADSKSDSIKIWEWKKGAILYADDDLVIYSVAQRLMTLISKEKINVTHVKDLSIVRMKDDLIFQVKVGEDSLKIETE